MCGHELYQEMCVVDDCKCDCLAADQEIMQILVELEGVLRGQRDEPIAAGIILTAQLAAYNQIVFITELSQVEAEQWINTNKVVDYDMLIDSHISLVDEPLKQRQLKYARARGNVDLVITNDPAFWAFAFEQGIPCMMFGVPSYTRPEFRPDAPKKVRAWADIEAAIAKQNELRTKDVRLTRTETTKFE